MNWSSIWLAIRRYLLNKYVLTLLVFGFIMFFVGDQSLRVRLHKAQQIRELEEQRDTYSSAIEEAKHELQILSSRDSLERYAREKYLMHAPGEDVYLVPEHDR
jgi:cell division protein FtsB